MRKKYTFKSFLPGIEFVNKIAQAAESAGHHPDITINYNVVGISLSTHSEGGVTQKDFDLASQDRPNPFELRLIRIVQPPVRTAGKRWRSNSYI